MGRRTVKKGDGGSVHGGSQASSWVSSRAEAAGAIGEVRVAIETVRSTIFGIALVAIKDTSRGLRWQVFDLVVQYAFVLLMPLAMMFWGLPGENGNPVPWGGPFTSFGQFLHDWVRFDGQWWTWGRFTILWAFVVAFVWLAAIDAAYVGYAFATHSFKLKFPLRYLRVFGHLFPNAIYIPFMVVLLEVFDCRSPDLGPTPHYSFPDVMCWKTQHVIYCAISAATLAMFLLLTYCYGLFFYEADPYRKDALAARCQSRSELFNLSAMLLVQNILCYTDINQTLTGLLSIGAVATALWSVLAYYPYYRLWMNQLRAGAYLAFLWIVVFMFAEGAFDKTLRAQSTPAAFYAILLVGVLPVGYIGYWYAGYRFRTHLCTGRAYGLALERAWHVEVATRFLHDDESPRAIELAESIFERGLLLYPYSSVVRIAYGSFQLRFSENKQAANRFFADALKFDPFLDMHFRCFRAEQDRLQETQSMHARARGGDLSEALITHLEFQKNIVGAKRYHKGAVRAFRKFWSLLMAEDVTLPKLEDAVARIDYNETRAQDHYKALLAQHPNNPRILRSYGKFHEEVLRDAAAAQDLYDAADEYEETQAAQEKNSRLALDADLDSDDDPSPADDGASTARAAASEAGELPAFPRPALNAAAPAPAPALVPSASQKRINFGPASFSDLVPGAQPAQAPPVGRQISFSNGNGNSSNRAASSRSNRSGGAPAAGFATMGPPAPEAPAPHPRASLRMLEATVLLDSDLDVIEAGGDAAAVFGVPPEKMRGFPLRDHIAAFEAEEGEGRAMTVGPDTPALVSVARGEGRGAAWRVKVSVIQKEPEGEPGKARLARSASVDKASQWLLSNAASSEPAPVGRPRGPSPMGGGAPSSQLSVGRKKSVQMDAKPQSRTFELEEHPPAKPASLPKLQISSRADAGDAASDVRADDDDEPQALTSLRGHPHSGRKGSIPGGSEASGANGNGKSAKWARKLNRLKRRVASSAGDNASIARMQLTIRAVILVLVVMAVACYVAMDNLLQVYQAGVTRVGLSGSRRFLSASLAVYGRMFSLAGLPQWDKEGTMEAHARAQLKTYINTLEQNHLQLGSVDEASEVTLYRLVQENTPGDEDGKLHDTKELVWDAILEEIDAGRELMKWESAAAFRANFPDPEKNDDFYVLSKDVNELYEALILETEKESVVAIKSFTSIRAFLIAMFLIATTLCFVLAVFFFRPTINAVHKEKEDMLKLFFDIPKQTLHNIMRVGKGPGGDDDDEDDLDDDDSLMEAAHKASSGGGKGDDLGVDADMEKAIASGRKREDVLKARKLHRIFVKGKKRVTVMTVRYTAAFLALFAVFFVWFVYAYVASTSCQYFTNERNAGGLRKSLTRLVFYYAQEMIVGNTGTFGAHHASEHDFSEDNRALVEAIERLDREHRALEYANFTEGLPGIAGRSDEMDLLLFGISCLEDRVACNAVKHGNGLSRYMTYYLTIARAFAASPRHLITPDNRYFLALREAAETTLESQLGKANTLLEQEAFVTLGEYLKLQQQMLGLVMAVVAVSYIVAFRVTITSVKDDARRTMFLLLMIPSEVIETVDSIRQLLVQKAAAAAGVQ